MEPSLLVSHSPYATQKVCAPQLSVPRKISARQGAIEAIEANYMTRRKSSVLVVMQEM